MINYLFKFLFIYAIFYAKDPNWIIDIVLTNIK